MWYIAGDIGGTNTRLLAIKWDGDRQVQRVQQDYDSQGADGLSTILKGFVTEFSLSKISAACFAVAGPVHQGVAKITNLPWQIQLTELTGTLNTEDVKLMNDFSGAAYGVGELGEGDLQTLQAAVAQKHGTRLVLGAGTGLGMAIIERSGASQHVLETEAGHVGFSPNDEQEVALMSYWQAKLGRVSNETFLSGKGIARIFDFYCTQSSGAPARALSDAMKAHDPAKVINEFAHKYKEPLAVQTMQRFATIYASVAGDMALATKATGGVYLAGGIAPSALAFLQTDQFIQTFNDKPPMQALLATIPVYVIMNTSVGLLGAMAVAKQKSGE